MEWRELAYGSHYIDQDDVTAGGPSFDEADCARARIIREAITEGDYTLATLDGQCILIDRSAMDDAGNLTATVGYLAPKGYIHTAKDGFAFEAE